jgi:outer membrane protein OmpA-like peptidoglycan-associated protein
MTDERTGGIDGFAGLFRRAGLADVLTSWLGGKEGKALAPAQLESALGAAAIDRIAASSGLTRAAVSSAAAYLLPRLIGWLTPNGKLPSTSALVSRVSGILDRPLTLQFQRPRRRWPGWLPWAAAALVAIAGLLWLRGAPGTIDPQLRVTNRDGKVTYSGLVRDQATRAAIVEALRSTFGETNVIGNLGVDRNVKRAAWLPRVGELFAALKVPGVELSLSGDSVSLGGWLSAADRTKVNEELHGILGSQIPIDSLRDVVADAVREANDKALAAIDTIRADASADALVSAMNLAVINFSTGSAQIPADSMDLIRKSAAAIQKVPAGAAIEIGGHTDDAGDPARNLELSQARAEAVKAALVAAGVPDAMLATKGYGDTRPRATNATEYGRFQNRRIEYAVVEREK